MYRLIQFAVAGRVIRETATIGATQLLLALGTATSAAAMGGMGGPSDAWGSPYALIAPQSFPSSRSTSGEGQARVNRPSAGPHPTAPTHMRKRPAQKRPA